MMSPESRSDSLVLAADVGGTKTAICLASARGGEPSRSERVASAAFADFESLARTFLGSSGDPPLAALAVAAAGPLADDGSRIDVTHLPWRIEAERLARALGAPRVALLNDVAASALGMLELPSDAFARLQGDTHRGRGTLAILGAGTGLGVAVVVFDGERARVLPSAGGHASCAARDAREIALLQRLADATTGHVPVEAVVSGPGLVRIHEFLRARGDSAAPPRRDAAAIAEAGLRGDDPLCGEALELFAACYGSEAGNLALRARSRGGVWLGGGIAPKILPALRRGGFVEAFCAKGSQREWLRSLPLAVCLAEDAPLRGALREARRIAAEAR